MATTTSRPEPEGVPAWVEPMLAKPLTGPLPAASQWMYEDKVDGYRCAARVAADGRVVLTSRSGRDFTAEFAELAEPIAAMLAGRAGVLDGEIVAYDPAGRIDFGLLQQRRGRYQRTRRPLAGNRPGDAVDIRFLAFDLLRLGETDLTRQPYDERRAQLTALPMPDPYRTGVVRAISYDRLRTDRLTPEALLARTSAAGYEGLVIKQRSSIYQPGRRSDAWLKRPIVHTHEAVLCGWRPGQGALAGSLGGLLLGAHDPATGDLLYIGDVGTGLSQAERANLLARLLPLERDTHPFARTPPREDTARARWLEPRLVGEVVFRQFTSGGRLRHTAWRGLRDDRVADDIILPAAVTDDSAGSAAPHPGAADVPEQPADRAPSTTAGRIAVQVENRRLSLSNLDKVLYPADGWTKAEVINYYTQVAPLMIPHLRDRPITVVRWPDGVRGPKFFGKNVPDGAPTWLRTALLSRSGSRQPRRCPLVDDLPSLVWLANLAAIELHVPQWTVDREGRPRLPDRLVLDLDPGEGTTVVECGRVAERLHEMLTADGFTVWPTTSGSKGLQLYAGIAARHADAPSAYARRLAQQLARETPDAVTAVMAKARRAGKVFVDWSQNHPAKTTISPYSLRGREHPTAATPLTWDEVRACRHATDLEFTADDVIDRIARAGDLLEHLEATRTPLP